MAQKLKLAKMHKVNPNKMFGSASQWSRGFWEARVSELSSPVLDIHGLWLSVSSGMMGSEFWSRWLPAVWHTQGCPAQCQPRHPCQFISTICPCSSFHSASLVKTSQDGSPRWLCMTAMAEGLLGDAECCCAVVAIIQADPGLCYIISPPQHLLSCET